MLRPLLLALAAAPAGGLASPGASQLRPRVTLSRCTPLTCLGQTSDAAAAAAAAPPLTAALTGAAPRDAPSVAPSPASLLEDNAAALLACALALVALSVTPAHAASAAAVVPSATAATTAAAAAASATPLTFSQVLEKAGKRALGGGLSGALAGVAQVLLLMWLRTTMNYQYRYGTGTGEALKTLWAQGGLSRLYRGLPFALLQTPLARFGDTAANAGMLILLADQGLPVAARTAIASGAASVWRIGLTPIDTFKTTLQVKGPEAYEQLNAKVRSDGPAVLFQGALANAAASFAGNYPWFLTYNALDEALPLLTEDSAPGLLLARAAALGLGAAVVSDCITNSLRVLKNIRQTSETTIGYREAVALVVEQDGWVGLFGRGLGTRLLTNSIQAVLFSVVWKLLEAEGLKLGLF